MARKPKFSSAAKKRNLVSPAAKKHALVTQVEVHSKEWLRRSKAAKKGWVTRKKRILPKKIARAKKLIINAQIALGKKPNPRIGNTKKKSVRQLEEMNQAAEEKIVELQRIISDNALTEGWVFAEDARMLREDFTIALEPCRLRHIGETEKLKRILNQASGGNFGVAAMDLLKFDRRRLAIAAQKMAEYYDIPLREVYTLFYSP